MKTFFLCLALPVIAFAQPIESFWPKNPITLPKGDGTLSLETTYQNSNDFYNSVGALKDSADTSSPTTTHEDYYDVVNNLSATYGLTSNWTLWLMFPVIYRERSAGGSSTNNWGLGDLEAGARYRFFHDTDDLIELAGEFNARFPSGSTAGSFSPPLGTGDARMAPALYAKIHPLSMLGVELSAQYTFRQDATVEYIFTPSLSQSSTDGSVTALLPIGNSNIDWGDEFLGRSAVGIQFNDRIALSGGIKYLYRRPTSIHTFLFTISGASVSSAPILLKSNSAWLLTASPSLLISPVKDFTIVLTMDWPIRGESYPILPVVESLVGKRYHMEVRYAF